ncbi:MAG: SAM-dependent methyltransferase [Verrucomicrobiales bacterium]|jgi:SAM-dependent methyltransferase
MHRDLPEPINLKSIKRIDKWLRDFLIRNRFNPLAFRNLDQQLLASAIAHKNMHWPRKIGRYVRGKDVLDVGCGRSLYAVGFLFSGAKSYTGVDPTLDLESNVIKDSSGLHGQYKESDWTPKSIESRLPNVNFVSGLTSDLPDGEQFDVLAMHNVTEHLMEIEDAFAEFATRIRPGGRIIFRHPSFHAWGGHHMKPRTLNEIVDGDEEQAKYSDWNHLNERADWPDKIRKKQNRIRLGELKALVEQHFELELWQTRKSWPNEGGERLTPEILARSPGFTEEELLTQCVICVGRKPE